MRSIPRDDGRAEQFCQISGYECRIILRRQLGLFVIRLQMSNVRGNGANRLKPRKTEGFRASRDPSIHRLLHITVEIVRHPTLSCQASAASAAQLFSANR